MKIEIKVEKTELQIAVTAGSVYVWIHRADSSGIDQICSKFPQFSERIRSELEVHVEQLHSTLTVLEDVPTRTIRHGRSIHNIIAQIKKELVELS